MPAPTPLQRFEEARLLIEQGMSMSGAAKEVGVDRATLFRHLGSIADIRAAAMSRPQDRATIPVGFRNLEVDADDEPRRPARQRPARPAARERRATPAKAAPTPPAPTPRPPAGPPPAGPPPAGPPPRGGRRREAEPEFAVPAAPRSAWRPRTPETLPPGLTGEQLARMAEAIYEAGTSLTLAAIGAGLNPARIQRLLVDASKAWRKGDDAGAAGEVALTLYGALAAYDERIGRATTRLAELGEVRALAVALDRARASTPEFNADDVVDGSAEVRGFADQVRRWANLQADEAPEPLGVAATRTRVGT